MDRRASGSIGSLKEETEIREEKERERVKRELDERLMREQAEWEKRRQGEIKRQKEEHMTRFNKGPVLGSGPKLVENTRFKIFTIESHSTLPILDGALKITCGVTPLSIKARICTHEDFAAVHASIMENNGVRL